MKMLLYCCKAKPYLYKTEKPMIEKMFGDYHIQLNKAVLNDNCLNGTIVAECDFEVEEIGLVEIPDYAGAECYTFVSDVSIYFETKTLNQDELFKKSCLNWEEMEKCLYSTNGKGYAIYIKNLHIFDMPRELSEYFTEAKKMNTIDGYSWVCESIDRAPRNMMYAYDGDGDKYIVISIQSQWMCLILNHIKDVEVRKKILKEML